MNSDFILGQVVLTLPTNSSPPVQSPTSGYVIGTVLSTTDGVWSQSPDTFRYQWQRDGVDIAGQTSSSYTIVAADHNTAINCNVWASNSVGESATFASTTATATLNLTPANSVVPVISGSLPVGSTLTVTNTGTWSNSPSSFTYQWKRAGSNIASATSSTYVTVTADGGTNVTCAVTAINSSGTGGTATSNALAITAVSGLGAFTDGQSATGSSSATTAGMVYPSGAAIYAVGSGYNAVGSTPGAPTISSSPSLTWTQVSTCSQASGTRRCQFTMWRATSTGVSTTVTINSSPNSSETSVRTAYVTGATTNVANAASLANTSSPIAVTLATPISTSYVFAAALLTGSLSITGPSGFTQVGSLMDNANLDISFYVDTTTPGTGVSFSRTSANNNGLIAVEVKAA